MATTDARTFTSKVDLWLVCLVVGGLSLPALLAIFGQRGFSSLPLVICGLGLAFFLWLLRTTDYTVTDTTLLVRSGPMRWQVPIVTIRAVRGTRNPLSSPALSLDRLRVDHTGGWLLISPRDKDGFIRSLLTVAPAIAVSGVDGFTESGEMAVPGDGKWQVLKFILPIQLAVVAIILVVLYAGARPPTVRWSADSVTIRGGMYSRTIHKSEVQRVSLEDTLPRAHRRAGFGAASYERGLFDVDTIGRATLFVVRGASPYLFIRGRNLPVIVNYKDPSETRALYEEFRRRWGIG